MPTDHLGKRRESTALERVRIIELNAEGYSQRDIASKMGSVSKTTVQRVLQQCKPGQLNPTPRNGRPPTLDFTYQSEKPSKKYVGKGYMDIMKYINRCKEGAKRRIYRASDADPGATLADLPQICIWE